jgi:hypothetical protein
VHRVGSRARNDVVELVARYLVQSLVSTFANLSMPNRIGATVNVTRNIVKAWATGSRRSLAIVGIGAGLIDAPMVLM